MTRDQGKIAVLGASGQLGRALLRQLGGAGVALARPEADLANMPAVLAALERLAPSAVINAAAYTQVDRAESDKEAAWQINALAPGELAAWARLKRVPLVHFSTDYVFSDGPESTAAAKSRIETDPTAPINVYGQSKLEGDTRVAAVGGNFLIFRTSWVYDATGKNFLNTVIRLATEKTELRIVNDQNGAPTFAKDLAEGTLKALTLALAMPGFPSGVYHLTNAGETSWHGFAQAIVQQARALRFPLTIAEVQPIPSSAYPTPAPRPKNSRLSNAKFKSMFGFELRDWEAALRDCMQERKGQ